MTLQRKITVLQNKLDKLIQQTRVDYFCLVCARPASVYHHYIQKKQSTYLRFNEKNLIPLCNSCHTGIHLRGDPEITRTIQKEMGEEWCEWIKEHRDIVVKRDLKYYEELKVLYDQWNGQN
jgi:hypothetical protein